MLHHCYALSAHLTPTRCKMAPQERQPEPIQEHGPYQFPAETSQWTAPDTPFCGVHVLNWLEKIGLNAPVHHRSTFKPTTKANVYQFLAHEAITANSEDTPSQDQDLMGALVFARLHHLNIHGFEVELEAELDTICKTQTTNHEQLVRIRGLLRDYCESSCTIKGPFPTESVL
jgi:hypothetical protein